MCVSAEADFAAAAVLAPAGVATLAAATRREQLLLASLPLVFAAHQFTEGFVWLGVDGDVGAQVQKTAIALYLVVAQVLLPVLVPAAFLLLAPPGARRRRATAVLLGVGALVAVRFAAILLTNPLGVEVREHLLVYDTDWEFGWITAVAYVAATCGPPLLAADPVLRALGVANLIGLALAALIRYEATTSAWCLYAAFASLLIWVSLRRTRAGPEPYAA